VLTRELDMGIERTIDIAAPKDSVWDVLTDVERWPQWTPTMRSVELLDETPFRVGARARIRQPRLPAAVWMVTVLQRQRYFAWENLAPGVRAIAGHRLEATGGNETRVTLSIMWTGWLAPLVRLLYGRLARRYVRTEAESLKRHVESAARMSRSTPNGTPVPAAT
jgi:uncharacterized membrane protein